MRTDCKVSETHGKDDMGLRVPQIPVMSAGRNSYAKRGDVVFWKINANDAVAHMGRVIGFVEADNIKGTYLLVAMYLSGLCCEHWVDPALVLDCHSLSPSYYEKMAWLFGPDFLTTPVDVARQCYELFVHQMKPKK